MTDSQPLTPPPPSGQPRPPYPLVPLNLGRMVCIIVGAVILFFGITSLALPVVAGAVGERINPGIAFLLAGAADILLAGVYVAGILVARRAPTGRMRAVPPAIACAVLLVGFVVSYPLIRALASF